MTRVLIADDHAVVRSGLRQVLAGAPERVVAGEAASAREALALAREVPGNVVLLDISLPDGSGLEVLRQIKGEQPELSVLMFSGYSEDECAMGAFDAGASGYLTKDSTAERIVEAIRLVRRGGRYVSPTLAERLLAGAVAPRRALPHEKLSPRELEVLRLLTRGESLTGIAERWHLSVKTISTYRARILEKLELKSNADLTRYVIEHRLDQ